MATQRNTTSRHHLRKEKARVNNEDHSSNFHAGYVQVNEEHLHKTGIRGKKKYLLYCVVASLVLVAVTNIISFELLSGGELLRFLQYIDVPSIHLLHGELGSRVNSGLMFSAANNLVSIGVNGSHVSLQKDKTTILTDCLNIISSKTGKFLFSTDPGMKWTLPRRAKNLHTSLVETSHVQSRAGVKDLVLESLARVTLKGAQGIQTNETKKVQVNGRKGIKLTSKKGRIVIEAARNITLPRVKHMLRLSGVGDAVDANLTNYKVCVCTPSGKLFLVPIHQSHFGCHSANEQQSPCID